MFVNPAVKITKGNGLGYGVFKTEGLTLVEKCRGIKCHDGRGSRRCRCAERVRN